MWHDLRPLRQKTHIIVTDLKLVQFYENYVSSLLLLLETNLKTTSKLRELGYCKGLDVK